MEINTIMLQKIEFCGGNQNKGCIGRDSRKPSKNKHRLGWTSPVLFLLSFVALQVDAAGSFSVIHPPSSPQFTALPLTPNPASVFTLSKDSSLTSDSITHLTMNNNISIKAAKYKLESAEHNYNLFESKYTQFSPFNMSTGVERGRYNLYEGRTSVGIEKEYFGGGSISADIGSRNIWGDDLPNGNTQFVETKVQFPLFSSNRRLTRIIERTFEENELYSAQLDYVNTIRNNIKGALSQYFDYIPRSQILKMFRVRKEELVQLKASASLSGRSEDRQQLDGEINSLTSRIQGWEIEVQSLMIEMEQKIGIEDIGKYKVYMIGLDFSLGDYFGAFYVSASQDKLLELALENDTELMVLELIRINAFEKKRLAQKGKWDIFLSIKGQYNFNEEIGGRDLDPYYEVGSEIVVKRFDRSVLLNTIQKSDADILNIDMTMKNRCNIMSAEISQKKIALLIAKDQVLSARKSIGSWEQVCTLKKSGFMKGEETADNYIQAFRSLTGAMQEELDYENDYLDRIRDFDYICGKYFTLLGIDAY